MDQRWSAQATDYVMSRLFAEKKGSTRLAPSARALTVTNGPDTGRADKAVVVVLMGFSRFEHPIADAPLEGVFRTASCRSWLAKKLAALGSADDVASALQDGRLCFLQAIPVALFTPNCIAVYGCQQHLLEEEEQEPGTVSDPVLQFTKLKTKFYKIMKDAGYIEGDRLLPMLKSLAANQKTLFVDFCGSSYWEQTGIWDAAGDRLIKPKGTRRGTFAAVYAADDLQRMREALGLQQPGQQQQRQAVGSDPRSPVTAATAMQPSATARTSTAVQVHDRQHNPAAAAAAIALVPSSALQQETQQQQQQRQQPRKQQQQQPRKQQQPRRRRLCPAAVTGIYAQPQQLQGQGHDTPTSPAAGLSGLGPAVLASLKREVAAVPDEQQQQQQQQQPETPADSPMLDSAEAAELQQLVQHYLMHSTGNKDLLGSRKRKLEEPAGDSLVEQQYGALVGSLMQLYQQVQIGGQVCLPVPLAAASSSRKRSTSSRLYLFSREDMGAIGAKHCICIAEK